MTTPCTPPFPPATSATFPHKNDSDGAFRVLPPVFRDFGGHSRFAGRSARQVLRGQHAGEGRVDSPGQGRVLVVDGGGSLRRALLGGNLGAAAARNGWAGIVIDGAVRDVAELANLRRGHPRAGPDAAADREAPRRPGRRAGAVVQGVWVRPGDWLYADEDGIVVMPEPA
jgi:regulator of ribonuclease activity A